MLSWVIQITFISVILIFLVHHLINFFKSTLTVPKIKDLVNTPNQNYENMYNIINSSNKENDYNLSDLIPKKEESMKDELKNFLKKQLNNSNNNDTHISALDSISSLHSFSIL